MRKDNSNNTGEQPEPGHESVDDNQRRCRIRGGRTGEKEREGSGWIDEDGKSKRVDCTANIDIANSPPAVYLVEGDELH